MIKAIASTVFLSLFLGTHGLPRGAQPSTSITSVVAEPTTYSSDAVYNATSIVEVPTNYTSVPVATSTIPACPVFTGEPVTYNATIISGTFTSIVAVPTGDANATTTPILVWNATTAGPASFEPTAIITTVISGTETYSCTPAPTSTVTVNGTIITTYTSALESSATPEPIYTSDNVTSALATTISA